MRSRTAAITAVGAFAVLAAATVVMLGPAPRGGSAVPTQTAAPRSPTATSIGTVTNAPATSAPARTAATYANTTYGFNLTLPEPYRKSARLSLANTGSQRPAAQDVFTARTEADEASVSSEPCQTGVCAIWNYVVVVSVNLGAGTQSPREWYTSTSSSAGEVIEDTTMDGRPAAKITNGSRYPLQYVIKERDRMFVVGFHIFRNVQVPAGATKQKLEEILTSFRFTP